MKKAEPQNESVTLKHVSFTVSQIIHDASGKQTVNRTYWSIRKKISLPDKNSHKLMSKASSAIEKSTRHDRPKKQGPFEKFTQLSLFPRSKQ